MCIQGVYKRMAQFQKLTSNLFLTLHGQNVHRQQRQLSKFLMRYQQFAFNAYCGAAGPVSKMASQQEKAFCVLRFEVSRSVITVQRAVQHGASFLNRAMQLYYQWHCFKRNVIGIGNGRQKNVVKSKWREKPNTWECFERKWEGVSRHSQ